MVDLPQIGTPMYISYGEGVNYRLRLEAVDGKRLSLAAPLETTGSAVPAPGGRLDVYWAMPRARAILPCRLVEIADAAPYQWVLEATGLPQPSNRRQFLRGGGGGAVTLAAELPGRLRRSATETTDPDDEAVVGRLLDISEGGLRCWVSQAPPVGTGDPLRASLPLGRTLLELTGAVHTVRDAFGEPGQHVILRFQPTEREAQLIRRHLYAWEIAERRRFGGDAA